LPGVLLIETMAQTRGLAAGGGQLISAHAVPGGVKEANSHFVQPARG